MGIGDAAESARRTRGARTTRRRSGVVLLVVLVAGATMATTAPRAQALATRPAVESPTVAAAPVAASPGCRAADPARLTGRLPSGGVDRVYEAHLPPRADPRRPLPVILAFHGRGERPAAIRRYSGLDAADAVVLYPQGREVRGQPGVTAWEGTRDFPVDGVDVRFVADLLVETARWTCVDPRRVVATGASQGGGFTHVLACTAPGTVAAIAPVAGAFYRPGAGGVRTCRSAPLRVLEFHGDADTVIAYGGTERSLPIPEWLAGWAAGNRCAATPASRPIPPDVTEQRWTGCAPGSALVHYLVRGGNHGWPAAPTAAILGPGVRTSTISATESMLAFFGIPRSP